MKLISMAKLVASLAASAPLAGCGSDATTEAPHATSDALSQPVHGGNLSGLTANPRVRL